MSVVKHTFDPNGDPVQKLELPNLKIGDAFVAELPAAPAERYISIEAGEHGAQSYKRRYWLSLSELGPPIDGTKYKYGARPYVSFGTMIPPDTKTYWCFDFKNDEGNPTGPIGANAASMVNLQIDK